MIVSPDDSDRYVVRRTSEFWRVWNLPRRTWQPEQARAAANYWTSRFVTEIGKAEGAQLRDVQGIALTEFAQNGGAFLSIPVGGGKTLLARLAPLAVNAQRPMIFMPASLIDKTHFEFTALDRHWQAPRPPPQIESFSWFAMAPQEDLLFRRRPDVIILDEADLLRRADRSVPERITRYCTEVGDACKLMFMSGTSMRKSIKDIQHPLIWTLRERAPIPRTKDVLDEWCSAIDEDSTISGERLGPGALLDFAAPELRVYSFATDDGMYSVQGPIERARAGYQRRLAETPGVVIVDESECEQPITIRVVAPPDDPIIEKIFLDFRRTWTTPDGWPVSDALSVFRHANEFGCGFYSMWDPRPPQEWIEARRDWYSFVRYEIERSKRTTQPFDTTFQVACAYPDHPLLLAWKEIEPTFTPNSIPVWFSGSVIYAVANWISALHAQGETALIWTQHNAVATALTTVTGLPYFGAKGERIAADGAKTGETIVQYASAAQKEIAKGRKAPSAILGIHSNSRGRNLQFHNRACIVGWPKAATQIEQWLGRMHRAGQTRPCTYDVFATSGETIDGMAATLREASFVQQTQGHTQKILKAQIDWSACTSLPELRSRWVQRG